MRIKYVLCVCLLGLLPRRNQQTKRIIIIKKKIETIQLAIDDVQIASAARERAHANYVVIARLNRYRKIMEIFYFVAIG